MLGFLSKPISKIETSNQKLSKYTGWGKLFFFFLRAVKWKLLIIFCKPRQMQEIIEKFYCHCEKQKTIIVRTALGGQILMFSILF